MLWRLLALPLLGAASVWFAVDLRSWIVTLEPMVNPLAPRLAAPVATIATFVAVVSAAFASVAAYTIGWLFNFALLLALRRGSKSALASAFSGSAMPDGWEKDGANAIVRAARLKDEADWKFARESGPLRYIFVRGGLVFGSVAFLGLHVVLNLVQSQPIVLSSLPLKFALWVLFGVLLTAPRWWVLKRASGGEA